MRTLGEKSYLVLPLHVVPDQRYEHKLRTDFPSQFALRIVRPSNWP